LRPAGAKGYRMRSARTVSTVTLRLPLGTGDARASAVGAAAAGVLVVIALALGIVPAVPGALGVRASLAIALVAAAGVLHHRLRHRKPPCGWVTVDTKGVHRLEQGQSSTLAEFDGPVGATVFASVDREHFAVALTSPRATRYVRAAARSAHDAAAAPTLIEWAITATDGVVVGHEESLLTASDAEKLIAELARRAPGALDRLVLSDATGEPMVLDRTELRLGSRRIDLCAPLEWRASFFEERGAYALSFFQATWVRQLDVEVVLVAPVPADDTEMGDVVAVLTADEPIGQAALARDVRLMAAAAGDPPPRELRRAIDRAFMLPLRRALDRAPRMARSSPSPLGRPVVESRRVDLDPREKLR
jgi:hypothetical protein